MKILKEKNIKTIVAIQVSIPLEQVQATVEINQYLMQFVYYSIFIHKFHRILLLKEFVKLNCLNILMLCQYATS